MFPCNYTTLYVYPLKGKLLTSKPTNHSSDPAESLFLAHETWGNGAAPSFMEALQSPQLISLFSSCVLEARERKWKCVKHTCRCLHLFVWEHLFEFGCWLSYLLHTHLDSIFTTGYDMHTCIDQMAVWLENFRFSCGDHKVLFIIITAHILIFKYRGKLLG